MDDDILDTLTSDFPAAGGSSDAGNSAEGTSSTQEGSSAAAGTPETPAEGQAAQTNAGAPTGTPAGDDGGADEVNLAKLQALASQRRAERGTTPTPAAAPESAQSSAPLTAEALAKALGEQDTFRAQVTKAIRDGDLETLARIADPDKADTAALYERMTAKALNPDSARVTDEVAALKARIAELEGKALPENVITKERLAEMEQQRAYEANRAAFHASAADGEKYPTLSKIDASLQLMYGQEAERLISDAGHQPTNELLLRIAEEVASSKLRGLIARNSGAAPETQGGSLDPKAAGAATAGETQASGGIDNRAASTTSATMPDPDDEDAWERRELDIIRGSRAQ